MDYRTRRLGLETCESGVRTLYGVRYGSTLLGVTVVVLLFTVVALPIIYQLLPESSGAVRSVLIPIALALLVVILIPYNRPSVSLNL